MLPKVLAFAGLASGFLVLPESLPPKVNDHGNEENAFKALPIEVTSPADVPLLDFATAAKSEVSVPCADCAHGDALRFQFTIQDDSLLTLNGFTIFPEPDPSRGQLTAQIEGTRREEPLGYSLWVTRRAIDEKQGMHVADLDITVLNVGRMPVSHVPAVKVKVLVAENGMTYIVDTKVLAPEPAPACRGLLCALKKMLGELRGKVGCHGGGRVKGALKEAADFAHGHGVPAAQSAKQQAEEAIMEEHERLKHQLHHREGIFQLVRNLLSQVVLPIVLGISAGVGVAVLAMLTANAIIFITRCLCGRRGDDDDTTEVVWYESLAAPRGSTDRKSFEVSDADAKDGLLEGQAPVPEYDHQVSEKA